MKRSELEHMRAQINESTNAGDLADYARELLAEVERLQAYIEEPARVARRRLELTRTCAVGCPLGGDLRHSEACLAFTPEGEVK